MAVQKSKRKVKNLNFRNKYRIFFKNSGNNVLKFNTLKVKVKLKMF